MQMSGLICEESMVLQKKILGINYRVDRLAIIHTFVTLDNSCDSCSITKIKHSHT